ncbi:MAG: hypothetical protein Q8P18_29720 [Pseudomonadota bacterium]|nr:hypothetical protein [Pseudomonadota bacterium]
MGQAALGERAGKRARRVQVRGGRTFANDRLQRREDGSVVVQLKSVWSDGTAETAGWG